MKFSDATEKSSATPGIDPGTFRILAQCLNHYATPGPPDINNVGTYTIQARDSAVGTATRYGLDGPGIESRWGARVSAPVQTGPGAQPVSCTMGTGSFPGVKRPGRGADHLLPSSAEVEGRVELYLCSPLLSLRGLFWGALYFIYTGYPRRNGQNFGRVFLMLNYTDITQNTYIQS